MDSADSADSADSQAPKTHRKTGSLEVKDTEDHLFSNLLAPQKNKYELLRIHFPELAKYVDKDSIKEQDPVFMGKEESRQISDLIFEATLTVKTRPRCDFLVLIEHQSTPDSIMSLRMLRGILAIWNKRRQKQETRSYKSFLRPVIPLVIFTGAKNWRMKSLRELGAEVLKPIKKHVPKAVYDLLLSGYADFRPLFWNLNKERLEDLLAAKSVVGMVLACFGSQHDKGQTTRLVREVKKELGLGNYSDQELVDCVTLVLNLLANREHPNYGKFMADLESVLEDKDVDFDKGSYAEKRWLEGQREGLLEGRREGRREGQLEGMRKVNKRLIKKKFPEADLQVVEAKLQEINDPEELAIMNEKIFYTQKLEDILEI